MLLKESRELLLPEGGLYWRSVFFVNYLMAPAGRERGDLKVESIL